MSNPGKPAWPDPGAFPFGLFGAAAAAPTGSGFAQPIAQGLTNGVDLMKKMLGQMPGASAIPGFLLPTVDIEELDKRIADLRAAESWLDVNLNLLRATIQGLEVQRNTVAAIKSFGGLGAQSPTAPSAPSAADGLPPGWPMNAPPAAAGSAAPTPVEAAPGAVETEPEPPRPRAPRPKKTAARAAPTPTDALASMAANNWLGYMQDQFSKVAKAALAPSKTPAATPKPSAAAAPVRKTAKKAKKAGRGPRKARP